LSLISGRKMLNYLQLKVSYFFSITAVRPYLWGKPAFLSVEPTTSCNLGCPECFTTQPDFTRPKGMLTSETFEMILSQAARHVFYLNLYFQGEPFLNKNLIDYILSGKRAGMYVAISTNGHFLDPSNAERIIYSSLDRLIVSLDGADAETYNLYRKGGDFESVVKGIKTVVELKKKKNSRNPFIELQFVVTRKNQSQRKEFINLGKELGVDKTTLKTFQLLNLHQAREWLPDSNSRYSISGDGSVKIRNKLRNRCFRMWSSCVITWEGNVIPCCFDKNASRIMGNINRQNLYEIWSNKEYSDFRKKVFSERKKIDICCNCSE